MAPEVRNPGIPEAALERAPQLETSGNLPDEAKDYTAVLKGLAGAPSSSLAIRSAFELVKPTQPVWPGWRRSACAG